MGGEDRSTVEIASQCKCGAAFKVRASPGDVAMAAHKQWRDIHSGDGHGNATAQQAAYARRRQQRERIKRLRPSP